MNKLLAITSIILLSSCGPDVDFSYDSKTALGHTWRNDTGQDVSLIVKNIDTVASQISSCTGVEVPPALIVFVESLPAPMVGRYEHHTQIISLLVVPGSVSILGHEFIHHILWANWGIKGHDSMWFERCEIDYKLFQSRY